MSLRKTRLMRELTLLCKDELAGIRIQFDGGLDMLPASMDGPPDSVYDGQTFALEIRLGESYPLEPPSIHFTTPIRHPNIDESTGRICLDLLKMPPEGSWRPNVSLGSVLVTIRVLLGAPNLEDVIQSDSVHELQELREVHELREVRETREQQLTAAPKRRSLSLAAASKRLK